MYNFNLYLLNQRHIMMLAYYLPNQSTAKVVQEAGLLFLYLLNLDQKIMNNVPWWKVMIYDCYSAS